MTRETTRQNPEIGMIAPKRGRERCNGARHRCIFMTEKLQAWCGDVEQPVNPGGVEFAMVAQVI